MSDHVPHLVEHQADARERHCAQAIHYFAGMMRYSLEHALEKLQAGRNGPEPGQPAEFDNAVGMLRKNSSFAMVLLWMPEAFKLVGRFADVMHSFWLRLHKQLERTLDDLKTSSDQVPAAIINELSRIHDEYRHCSNFAALHDAPAGTPITLTEDLQQFVHRYAKPSSGSPELSFADLIARCVLINRTGALKLLNQLTGNGYKDQHLKNIIRQPTELCGCPFPKPIQDVPRGQPHWYRLPEVSAYLDVRKDKDQSIAPKISQDFFKQHCRELTPVETGVDRPRKAK